MSAVDVSLAGWPLRHFTPEQMEAALTPCTPSLVEISKDMLRGDVSLKVLAAALGRIRAGTGAALAFAGTTDLAACAGLPWAKYRRYLAVQIAQARFLECSAFRFFVGARTTVPIDELIDRVDEVCGDLAPMAACVELHAGIESEMAVLAELLRRTSVRIVVDLENVQRARLTTDALLAVLPLDRIAYFHQRNLPGVWAEHPSSLPEESRWREVVPAAVFLWEPKTIDDPQRILELFREYRRSH